MIIIEIIYKVDKWFGDMNKFESCIFAQLIRVRDAKIGRNAFGRWSCHQCRAQQS